MKKKVLLIMGLCILLLAGGCTKKDAGSLSGDSSDNSDTSVTGIPTKEEYKVSDYITLGEYKGVEVTVDKLEVTDADVEDAITSDLENNEALEEITDRDVVQDGDIVNIDYEGLKDGVAFDGGTDTGYDLTIGSGQFIDGFEDGLIGKKVGDKVALDLTFPEDYSNSDGTVSDLAGQAVVFNVTINKIQQNVVPELTEDYVKNNTDYDSIDAYKQAMREKLEAENQTTMDNQKTNNVITAILDASTISSYPQTLIDYFSAYYTNYMTQMLYYSYGVTISEYLEATGSTQEDFDSAVQSFAENYSSLELIERAIAEAEGMTITDEDYSNGLDSYMEDMGVDTEEELLTYATKEEIKDDMLLKKALQFAVDNAVVTEVTPTTAPTATPVAAE